MAARTGLERVQNLIKNHGGRFDRVLEKLKITTAEDGRCVAELKVEEEHTNPMGGLHGGLSATLIDDVSSWGLFTHKNAGVPSVSVDLHATYIKGAQIGDEIVIESKTLKSGKTLAFLEVLIKNKKTGELLVKGAHTKYLVRPGN